jgi:hypothetical protein
LSFCNILHSPLLIPVCWPLQNLRTLKTGIVLVMILDIYCNTTVKGCRNSMGYHFFCILILHPLLSFMQYPSCGSYSTACHWSLVQPKQSHWKLFFRALYRVLCHAASLLRNFYISHLTVNSYDTAFCVISKLM